ncbi:MAG: rod shape-determining protein MreD [Sedimentisphaerales bacterium]|nr:rod shape-determining protein MreD [Sedimentisphaerales bacterium]
MRWPRFVVLVLITTLLQASGVNAIAVTRLNVSPDLLLIVMVFCAIRCNLTEAIISSFALGFAADIVATGFPMGPRIISFGLFGTGLAYLHRVIAIKKMHHELLAILVVGFGAGGLALLLALLAGQSPRPSVLVVLAGTSIYSAVLGPFLFLLLGWSMRIKSRRRGPPAATR